MSASVSARPVPLTPERLTALVAPILRKYGVKSAAVFGSVARGEASSESDVDLLVEYPEGMTAMMAMDLKEALEAELGRSVDLVPPRYLKRHVKPSALAEQIRIY